MSIPSDDWDKPAVLPLLSQSCGHSIPSPDALAELVEVMSTSQNMALVVGSDVDRQGALSWRLLSQKRVKLLCGKRQTPVEQVF
nr:hypothetical protein [Psychrobacter sp. PraFG1]UNK06064.1 hypothetical protein MN210_05110 [Psychrobacter sp. PraFG1]